MKSVRADNVRELLDVFIILGILTILTVRFFLWMTGYPQIGGGTFHIAHMLWGGLLMMAALILEQSIILRWVRRAGAIIGGIGFGLFIDELGKFITRDNDYFFRPTAALIYLLFILIYFLTRFLLKSEPFSPQESLANTIDYLKEAAVGSLSEKNKYRALEHLARVPDDHPLKAPLHGCLADIRTIQDGPPSILERMSRWSLENYRAMISSRVFPKAIALFFLGVALYELADLKYTLRPLWDWKNFQLVDWARSLSSLATFLLILIGDFHLLRRKRAAAYRWFERALFVSILIGQVFVFVRVQMRGFLWLGVLLFLLVGIRFLMAQEARLGKSREPTYPVPPIP